MPPPGTPLAATADEPTPWAAADCAAAAVKLTDAKLTDARLTDAATAADAAQRPARCVAWRGLPFPGRLMGLLLGHLGIVRHHLAARMTSMLRFFSGNRATSGGPEEDRRVPGYETAPRLEAAVAALVLGSARELHQPLALQDGGGQREWVGREVDGHHPLIVTRFPPVGEHALGGRERRPRALAQGDRAAAGVEQPPVEPQDRRRVGSEILGIAPGVGLGRPGQPGVGAARPTRGQASRPRASGPGSRRGRPGRPGVRAGRRRPPGRAPRRRRGTGVPRRVSRSTAAARARASEP